ncbi:MAG: hypothetical protein QXG05_00205 [Nitrososphaerota archaeon]
MSNDNQKKGNAKVWKIATLAFIIAFGLVLGAYTQVLSSSSPKQNVSSSTQPTTVELAVVPDWGGSGYDAFVPVSNFNGTVPSAASSGPGPNYNTIVVPANKPIKFVIVNVDTAVNENFSGTAALQFSIYNDTDSGQTPVVYSQGNQIQNLPVAHSFDIPQLNVNVPIPPDTMIVFNYTFTTLGTYMYLCEVPCGPGMGLLGYMNGYIVVTSS